MGQKHEQSQLKELKKVVLNVKGCDSNFEVKCLNFKIYYK